MTPIPLMSVPTLWKCKEERVWRNSTRGWTWCVYPFGPFSQWWHVTCGNNVLQEARCRIWLPRGSFSKVWFWGGWGAESLLSCFGLASCQSTDCGVWAIQWGAITHSPGFQWGECSKIVTLIQDLIDIFDITLFHFTVFSPCLLLWQCMLLSNLHSLWAKWKVLVLIISKHIGHTCIIL